LRIPPRLGENLAEKLCTWRYGARRNWAFAPYDNEAVMATSDDLMAALDEVIALLDRTNEPHWRDWMANARARLHRADVSGLDKILGAYGGMGSFNDLIIGYRSAPVDNKGSTRMEWDDDGRAMDERLCHLRGLIAELAWKQRTEITGEDGR
jgi:hypothetical protein